jgi:hypothetical protein
MRGQESKIRNQDSLAEGAHIEPGFEESPIQLKGEI